MRVGFILRQSQLPMSVAAPPNHDTPRAHRHFARFDRVCCSRLASRRAHGGSSHGSPCTAAALLTHPTFAVCISVFSALIIIKLTMNVDVVARSHHFRNQVGVVELVRKRIASVAIRDIGLDKPSLTLIAMKSKSHLVVCIELYGLDKFLPLVIKTALNKALPVFLQANNHTVMAAHTDGLNLIDAERRLQQIGHSALGGSPYSGIFGEFRLHV
mmetsp:Transcript_104121/g.167783  ORF Transcript_104121/g.167783 Transcript_104121/m.167783 type:complete len:214 (+) Transcript_104121:2340-2981(+)